MRFVLEFKMHCLLFALHLRCLLQKSEVDWVRQPEVVHMVLFIKAILLFTSVHHPLFYTKRNCFPANYFQDCCTCQGHSIPKYFSRNVTNYEIHNLKSFLEHHNQKKFNNAIWQLRLCFKLTASRELLFKLLILKVVDLNTLSFAWHIIYKLTRNRKTIQTWKPKMFPDAENKNRICWEHSSQAESGCFLWTAGG